MTIPPTTLEALRGANLVYFLQSALPAPHDLVKIGATSDLQRRYSDLCAVSAAPLNVIGIITMASMADALRFEGQLHEHFADHRVHHEWFRAPRIVEYVDLYARKLDRLKTSDLEEEETRPRYRDPATARALPPPEHPWLTDLQAAKILRTTPSVVRKLADLNLLRHLRIGKRLRFQEPDLEKAVQDHLLGRTQIELAPSWSVDGPGVANDAQVNALLQLLHKQHPLLSKEAIMWDLDARRWADPRDPARTLRVTPRSLLRLRRNKELPPQLQTAEETITAQFSTAALHALLVCYAHAEDKKPAKKKKRKKKTQR